MKAQASSIASIGVSLASPQFAISRPSETAKSWRSLPLNAELLGCPRGGLFSTVANSPMRPFELASSWRLWISPHKRAGGYLEGWPPGFPAERNHACRLSSETYAAEWISSLRNG